DSVVKVFNKTDRLAIALAPEGTRKKVETFKTGYYYIALGAGVPIIPTVFNWEEREVIFMDPIHLTGDADEELAMVENIFRNYKGRNKENSFT
ncbi:MAG: glycerol acyltransferase, partial [Saprospiraceae bacterium]